MVRYIDTMNLIALWIVDGTIKRTPAETERPNEEVVEEPYIKTYNRGTTDPPTPGRNFLQKTYHDTRAFSMPWAVICMSSANAFTTDNFSLDH
jgi:hypothetical protein